MAELRVVEGLKAGAVFPLDPEHGALIGRDPKCAITLSQSKVSARHARLTHRDGGWLLEDLNSTNGTFVNGRRINRVVLRPGDQIKVGPYVLVFTADKPAAAEQGAPVSEESVEAPSGATEVERSALSEAARRLGKAAKKIQEQMAQVIVGQQEVIEHLLLALFARGHVLLVGVPGLAKTLMVRTLAGILDLSFKRVQFTPDLMPADIIGTEILEEDPATHARAKRFVKGPVFTNVLLADEINRTPPKTQAALLEAMQEYRVTAGGQTFELPLPFFVLATQNPIEQEGTYPLPEAQLDRFMFNCVVSYPSRREEVDILRSTTIDELPSPRKVLTAQEILACQDLVRALPVSDYVLLYAADLARASRPGQAGAPDFVDRFVAWGAGPRAAQCLVLGAKARALIHGRVNVSTADIRALAHVVLRHRVFLNFHADAEGLTVDTLIDRLLEAVPEPSADDLKAVEGS